MDICAYIHSVFGRAGSVFPGPSKPTLTRTATESAAQLHESADGAHATGLVKRPVRPTRSAAQFPANL